MEDDIDVFLHLRAKNAWLVRSGVVDLKVIAMVMRLLAPRLLEGITGGEVEAELSVAIPDSEMDRADGIDDSDLS